MPSVVMNAVAACTSAAYFPNADGIRSTIRFLGATNEKIRALKAEELVDKRFVKKLEQEGGFNFCVANRTAKFNSHRNGHSPIKTID